MDLLVEVLSVPRHCLVILVAMDSLLVLRESELVEALGGNSLALAECAIRVGDDTARSHRL